MNRIRSLLDEILDTRLCTEDDDALLDDNNVE